MTLALILTPYKDRAFDTISIPLGIAWLYSYLFRELPMLKIEVFDFLLEPELEVEFFDNVKKNKYDVIGIQAHSNATAHEAVRISRIIKQINSSIKIIIGGNAATFAPYYFLSTNYVDFISFGEGELTLKELLTKLLNNETDYNNVKGIAYIENNKLIITPRREQIEDLNSLPLPDRDPFHWKKYPQWSLITSRGCPYSCTYCSSTKFWRNQIRFRSADNVFEEILLLKNRYHVKRLYILDDTFGVNKEQITILLNKMIENHINLEWACLTRAEIMDKEYMDLFKRAGCVQIHFGLESANIETQNKINKHLDLDYLSQMVKYAQSISLRTKLSVIFGLPGETEKQILNTIEYLLKLQPNEVQIYPLMPYIGIEILDDETITELKKGEHFWKQDALIPLTESDSLPTQKQKELTQFAIEKFRTLGYKWIPMDINPEKHDEVKIIKTVFAPIQGLKKKGTE